MAAVIIWLNSDFAKLFFSDENALSVEKIILRTVPESATENLLFWRVTEGLKYKDSSVWVLVGPNDTHGEFHRFLIKYFPEFERRVVAVCETSALQESEILSFGQSLIQKYYKTQNLKS